MTCTHEQQTESGLTKLLEESRSEASRLQTLVDMIPGFAWRSSPDGSKEFLNQRWHEYTGLSLEEAHGYGWTAVVHPDDLEPLEREWQRILASGEPGEMETRIRRFDGQYRWFLIRAVPKRNDQGEIVNWYGSNTDIEDRKRRKARKRCHACKHSGCSYARSRHRGARPVGCSKRTDHNSVPRSRSRRRWEAIGAIDPRSPSPTITPRRRRCAVCRGRRRSAARCIVQSGSDGRKRCARPGWRCAACLSRAACV